MDIKQLLDLFEVGKPMPVFLDKASGSCKPHEQILVMPFRERMPRINRQQLDQGEVVIGQPMQLVKVAIHGDAVRSGWKYRTISQAIELTVNGPRLQVMLPDVMLSPLLHDHARRGSAGKSRNL